MPQIISHHPQDQQAAAFLGALKDTAVKNGVFDSAAAGDTIANMSNQQTEAPLPEEMKAILDAVDDAGSADVVRAFMDGAREFERQHGFAPPPDLLRTAIHAGRSVMDDALRKNQIQPLDLDDTSIAHATNMHSEPRAFQPRRIVVAVLTALTEAVPWALYLPADIESGEARLAVLRHQAGNTFGGYAENASLDGINAGEPFVTSERWHKCTVTDDTTHDDITGYLTQNYSAQDVCDQTLVSGSDGGMKWLRGRGEVHINGRIVAREARSDFALTGANSVSGAVTIGSTTHIIAGTFNPDTGQIALTATPKLPASTDVLFRSFIDWERDGDNIPKFSTDVRSWSLFAHPHRAWTEAGIDSRKQMTSELSLDPFTEGVVMIQSQVVQERHYLALRMAKRLALGSGLTASFDFAYPSRGIYMVRPDIWIEFMATIGELSQRMAIATKSHGISHLYVGANVAAMLQSVPSGMFQSSGISDRPGIYRVGRLFGKYDVYYSPKLINEDLAGDTAEMLCIGRGPDVVRSPVVLGECVAPTMIPLPTDRNLNTGQGYYMRNFTDVNPFEEATYGAAMITLTNLFTAPS